MAMLKQQQYKENKEEIMARGTMYQIVRKTEDIGTMNEYDFYDMLERLHCDYVKREDTVDSEINLGQFFEVFEKNGILITKMLDGTGFHFCTPDKEGLLAFQTRMFHGKWKRFLDASEKLGETNFASNNDKVDDLLQIIEETYSDAVYYRNEFSHDHFLTFDRFIRSLEPDTDYFISNYTMLIH